MLWPIILFITYIIRTVVDFRNNKDIKLARGYGMILRTAVLSNDIGGISDLLLVGEELEITDAIVREKNNKVNMILNILMYIVTIISLLLVGLFGTVATWIYGVIVVMYAILVIIPILIFWIDARKLRKERIEELAKVANMSKRKLTIMSLVTVLIFLLPFIILGIIFNNIEMNKFDYPKKVEIVKPNNDINVKDNDYVENSLTQDDYEKIEKEISNILEERVVYKQVNFEENLKNEYGERYNKITVVANLVMDKESEKSYIFIFNKYLTSSEKHKLGEMETYLYSQSSTVLKKDWYEQSIQN